MDIVDIYKFSHYFSHYFQAMASILKRPKSPYFFCSFRAADGRWLKKSTKQKNRSAAMSICVQWEQAAKQALSSTLTAAQARKVVAEMVRHSTGEELTHFTVNSWLKQWLQAKRGEGIKPSTLTRYTQVVEDFLKHLGGKAHSPLSSVIPADIEEYRKKLKEGGRIASTINITIKKILSGPFREAFLQGHIPINPVAAVKPMKEGGRRPKSIREPFTHQDVINLLSNAGEEWRGLITLGATTGLRIGDASSLKWENISEGFISLETQKNGEDVRIPIHKDFAQFLESRIKGIGLSPVFTELFKRKRPGRSGLSRQFHSLMIKSGVRMKVIAAQGKAGRTRYSKSYHSFRYYFISSLANAGVSKEIRQKLTAHADEKTHSFYTQMDKETFRSAVEKIPTLRKARGTP